MNTQATIDLLCKIIATPSLSREENEVADILIDLLRRNGYQVERLQDNLWVQQPWHNPDLPTVLLNSHIDTVRSGAGWQTDPCVPVKKDGKIVGLGSNDAGASLVSLLSAFISFSSTPLSFNLIFAASAEEEISGSNGMELLVRHLPKIDFAIVGEPTSLDMAIAEKGLMVVDCIAHGEAGHAARDEGRNAIDIALNDIQLIHGSHDLPISDMLGPVKMTTTIIEAGSQHNVVPDLCKYTVDTRTTDACGNQEVLDYLKDHLQSSVEARSTRLNASGVDAAHPILKVARQLSINTYGSPTLSDQALMPWPSIKLGPGDSARSHTANEYILEQEIADGIEMYRTMIKALDNETLG